MANKYLSIDSSGNKQEVEALVASEGAGDAGKIPALDETGRLSDTVMPVGIGAETVTAVAGENLSANDCINLYDDAGTLKAQKADASDETKPCHGYVKDGVTLGSNATVYLDGLLPGTGFTKGSKYFLSETPGAVTATPITTSGAILQLIGVAVSATEIRFEPEDDWVIRA